jgi:hypothetical protein
MGAFQGYEFKLEGNAPIYMEEQIAKDASNPVFADQFNTCQAGGYQVVSCLSIASCKSKEGQSNEYCSAMKDICTDNVNPNQCLSKLTDHFKQKEQK